MRDTRGAGRAMPVNDASLIRGAVAGFAVIGGVFVGGRSLGPLPALGPLLDPAGGVWAVARGAPLPRAFDARIPTLEAEVRVVYDRRGVPHIWASSVDDAMRALGFVVARDRLFQLELQTRAVTGRLTEVVGSRALAADQEQRALGLAWSAERVFGDLPEESAAARAATAYAEGVNAWIDQMRPRDLPFEYHVLAMRPERWQPINSLHLLKRMGYTLTYSRHELWRSEVEALVGKEAAAALFPVNSPIQEPIQPTDQRIPRFDFREPPPPAPVDERARASGDRRPWRSSQLLPWTDGAFAVTAQHPAPAVGSNNWVVGPSRSASGHALLAGDPHLQLTLPSIWYEVHVVVPGELDVYGVTIPGSPGVIIGFNRHVAWSMTNTGADVLDFYREDLDEAERPSRYRVDGAWRPLEPRIEQYFGPDGDVIATDTIYFTHRGPLVRTDEGPLSMRWTVLEDTGATEALLEASRTTSVPDFLAAVETFFAPAQNFAVADRTGNIAIRSTGRFPIRPQGGGWAVQDGTASAVDWSADWDLDRYPFALNPLQGYLASANQQPKDPAIDSAYLGVHWPSPWRAMRINALLRADSQVTPDAMRRYQIDPGNARADLFVPLFLEAAERVLAGEPNDDLAEAARLLGQWDRRYTKQNERAILFELAWDELVDRTWDELVLPGEDRRVATPSSAILARLVSFAESIWWDRVETPDRRETRDEILAVSLAAAFANATSMYGQPDAGGWRWDGIRHANIYHLAGFRSLSALDLPVQGGRDNLNPSSGSGIHGASWRMVVELGPDVRAWATYPGGQSGNPASPRYDDRIVQWVDGVLEPVLFPREPSALAESDVAGEFTLLPRER